jgi:hypothetical protein
LELTASELHDLSGWEIKPEGACRDDVCVPLPDAVHTPEGLVDVTVFADRLAMPMANDEPHGLWALGPPAGGKVLDTVTFPELTLEDFDGHTFDFAGARGRKVVMIAWASW